MFNNRIKAKAKLYFDVDGESVTASEESLSDAAAKVKCIFRKQLFDPDKTRTSKSSQKLLKFVYQVKRIFLSC